MNATIAKTTLDSLLMKAELLELKDCIALLEAGANPNQSYRFEYWDEGASPVHILTSLSWDYVQSSNCNGAIIEFLKRIDADEINATLETYDLERHPYGAVFVSGHCMEPGADWHKKLSRLFDALHEAGIKLPRPDDKLNLIEKIYYHQADALSEFEHCSPDLFAVKLEAASKLMPEREFLEMINKERIVEGERDIRMGLLEASLTNPETLEKRSNKIIDQMHAISVSLVDFGADIYHKNANGVPLIQRLERLSWNDQADLFTKHHVAYLSKQASKAIADGETNASSRKFRL